MGFGRFIQNWIEWAVNWQWIHWHRLCDTQTDIAGIVARTNVLSPYTMFIQWVLSHSHTWNGIVNVAIFFVFSSASGLRWRVFWWDVSWISLMRRNKNGEYWNRADIRIVYLVPSSFSGRPVLLRSRCWLKNPHYTRAMLATENDITKRPFKQTIDGFGCHKKLVLTTDNRRAQCSRHTPNIIALCFHRIPNALPCHRPRGCTAQSTHTHIGCERCQRKCFLHCRAHSRPMKYLALSFTKSGDFFFSLTSSLPLLNISYRIFTKNPKRKFF